MPRDPGNASVVVRDPDRLLTAQSRQCDLRSVICKCRKYRYSIVLACVPAVNASVATRARRRLSRSSVIPKQQVIYLRIVGPPAKRWPQSQKTQRSSCIGRCCHVHDEKMRAQALSYFERPDHIDPRICAYHRIFRAAPHSFVEV
jgi:hypothetical protein